MNETLSGKPGAVQSNFAGPLHFTTTARNSEAVIGVAVAEFPGHPLVYLAIILGPIVELPMLLVIARVMLALRRYIGHNGAPEST